MAAQGILSRLYRGDTWPPAGPFLAAVPIGKRYSNWLVRDRAGRVHACLDNVNVLAIRLGPTGLFPWLRIEGITVEDFSRWAKSLPKV